jgi:hypothetical protein
MAVLVKCWPLYAAGVVVFLSRIQIVLAVLTLRRDLSPACDANTFETHM